VCLGVMFITHIHTRSVCVCVCMMLHDTVCMMLQDIDQTQTEHSLTSLSGLGKHTAARVCCITSLTQCM
jgi:hypothetical protein